MFRRPPPIDIVEQVLRSLKFTGLQDKRWFVKEDLPLDNLDSWLPLVEPYYLPCKADRFLSRQMTPSRIITVLRHICKINNIEIKVQERIFQGKKTTMYQIYYDHVDPIVRFD
jgi:hypothetical protein